MADFLEHLNFDFSGLLELISGFFSMLRNVVWNDELTGLITYLYSCIPGELRDYMIVIIIFAVILGIRELLRKD